MASAGSVPGTTGSERLEDRRACQSNAADHQRTDRASAGLRRPDQRVSQSGLAGAKCQVSRYERVLARHRQSRDFPGWRVRVVAEELGVGGGADGLMDRAVAARARMRAFSCAVHQIRPSGTGGRSRIGTCTMSSRRNSTTPSPVGWTMRPRATRDAISWSERNGTLRGIGRAVGRVDVSLSSRVEAARLAAVCSAPGGRSRLGAEQLCQGG